MPFHLPEILVSHLTTFLLSEWNSVFSLSQICLDLHKTFSELEPFLLCFRISYPTGPTLLSDQNTLLSILNPHFLVSQYTLSCAVNSGRARGSLLTGTHPSSSFSEVFSPEHIVLFPSSHSCPVAIQWSVFVGFFSHCVVCDNVFMGSWSK